MSQAPIPIDLLIDARWIAPVDKPGILKNHAVAIHHGQIIDLLPLGHALQRYQAEQRTSLPEHLLIPGLINAHTHAAMSLMRGLADDLPLMTWLQDHIWPTESAFLSHDFVLDGTRLACAEMLKGGITCFSDMYFFPDAAASAAAEYGMRAMIGILTMEFPTAYAADGEDYLHRGLTAREKWLDHPTTHFCLAPHAPYTVPDAIFTQVLTLSEQLNLPIHCHIHETRQEITDSLNQHGKRPLQRLAELGLLGPAFFGVHAVHLDDNDIQLLRQQGCSTVHCPTSNLKLGSGIAPLGQLRACGINVALGTDGAASNNRLDLFSEMRLASLLAKGSSGDPSALPCAEILHMATLGGAIALDLEDKIGSITPGKAADLCAVRLTGIESSPCYDPLSHLINVAGRECVSHVWVAGKCCVRDSVLQTQAANRLEASLALWQNKLESRRKVQKP
ncbi:MAG: TRZ/ATZ family hydrolase [Rhodocyclales bacterium]|nr:TRZ/ATZ family hydrolase [Rhodocyclales bacterium]